MMKMIFTFLLASALAMSAVLGRSSGHISKQIMYEKEDKTFMQSEETAQIMGIDDRLFNLKFVMAIKSSSIWAEIKQRSLTINTRHSLDETVAEKSPENLSDQELAQLKQACHDGLKCVAVDHLLVLEQVKVPFGDGKVLVRMTITKITQVLTQYTTEYKEDVYQYKEVSVSDDESKVYKSVTTIMEDNKELCQINFTPATEESNPKNDEGNAVPVLVVDNKNTVNYNLTNNYNINNGTINSATISKTPSDIITVVESPEPGTQSISSDPNLITLIHPQTKSTDSDEDTQKHSLVDNVPKGRNVAYGRPSDESETNETNAGNDGKHNPVRQNHAWDSGTSDRHYEPVATTDDDSDNTQSTYVHLNSVGSEDDNRVSADYSSDDEKNVENGQTIDNIDCDHDIVSVDSDNLGIVRKGYVEDGTLNNGNMVLHNINNDTINKGTISDSNAKNGIIGLGTINNGPVNYGTAHTYTNNGKQIAMNNYDFQQYLSNIDKMYSTILERLG